MQPLILAAGAAGRLLDTADREPSGGGEIVTGSVAILVR